MEPESSTVFANTNLDLTLISALQIDDQTDVIQMFTC